MCVAPCASVLSSLLLLLLLLWLLCCVCCWWCFFFLHGVFGAIVFLEQHVFIVCRPISWGYTAPVIVLAGTNNCFSHSTCLLLFFWCVVDVAVNIFRSINIGCCLSSQFLWVNLQSTPFAVSVRRTSRGHTGGKRKQELCFL